MTGRAAYTRMDYDDYKREEQLEEYARQFGTLRDLGMDAAALAAGSRPDIAQQAEELRGAAEVLGPQYATMSPPLRGVALARMLAVVARLFELGQSLARRPLARVPAPEAEDDLISCLPELLPHIRDCAKFLSDEIAVYVLYIVQEESTKATTATTLQWDCDLTDQVSADYRLAQSIHDRDVAYAANYAPPHTPATTGSRFEDDPWGDLEADEAEDLEAGGYGAGGYGTGGYGAGGYGAREYGDDPWSDPETDNLGCECGRGDRAFDPALDGWGLGGRSPDFAEADPGEEAPGDAELVLLVESGATAAFAERAAVQSILGRGGAGGTPMGGTPTRRMSPRDAAGDEIPPAHRKAGGPAGPQ